MVLAVVGSLSGLAVYAGVGAIRSAQTARHASAAMGHLRLAQISAMEYHLMRRVRFDPNSMVGTEYTRYFVEVYTNSDSGTPCSPADADGELPVPFAAEVTEVLPEGVTVQVQGARDLNDGRGPMFYFDCTGKPFQFQPVASNVVLTFKAAGTANKTVTIQRLSGRILDNQVP